MSHSSAQNSGLKYGRDSMRSISKIPQLLQQIRNLNFKKKKNSLIHLAELIYFTQIIFFSYSATLNLFELASEREGDGRHENHDAPQQRDQDVAGCHDEEQEGRGVLPLEVVDHGPVLSGPH